MYVKCLYTILTFTSKILLSINYFYARNFLKNNYASIIYTELPTLIANNL